MKRPLVVLLTATIDPGEMESLRVRDPRIRRQAYEQALGFYSVALPDTPVIFCENTGHDLAGIREIAARKGSRSQAIEVLSFSGNRYPVGLGKGFGEIGILGHALTHSRLLPEDALVLKVTGRLIVRNVASLLARLARKPQVELFCDLRGNLSWADSRVFAATTRLLRDCLVPLREMADDARGDTFEVLLARAAHRALARGGRWEMLPTSPRIEGVSATSGERYPNSWIARFRRESFRWLKTRTLGR